MPKIIKNLQERILEAAEFLFSKHEYNDVDMRAISNKAGIAVGTLYNYFPDKKSLFVEIFKKTWKKTFSKLEDIIQSDYCTHKKLLLFVDEVYEGIVQRRGTGIQLLVDSLYSISKSKKEENRGNQYDGVEQIVNELKEKSKIIIIQVANAQSVELDEYTIDKLANTLLLLVWGSVSYRHESKDKSIRFICDIIESYISNKLGDKKDICMGMRAKVQS